MKGLRNAVDRIRSFRDLRDRSARGIVAGVFGLTIAATGATAGDWRVYSGDWFIYDDSVNFACAGSVCTLGFEARNKNTGVWYHYWTNEPQFIDIAVRNWVGSRTYSHPFWTNYKIARELNLEITEAFIEAELNGELGIWPKYDVWVNCESGVQESDGVSYGLNSYNQLDAYSSYIKFNTFYIGNPTIPESYCSAVTSACEGTPRRAFDAQHPPGVPHEPPRCGLAYVQCEARIECPRQVFTEAQVRAAFAADGASSVELLSLTEGNGIPQAPDPAWFIPIQLNLAKMEPMDRDGDGVSDPPPWDPAYDGDLSNTEWNPGTGTSGGNDGDPVDNGSGSGVNGPISISNWGEFPWPCFALWQECPNQTEVGAEVANSDELDTREVDVDDLMFGEGAETVGQGMQSCPAPESIQIILGQAWFDMPIEYDTLCENAPTIRLVVIAGSLFFAFTIIFGGSRAGATA